MGRLLKITEGKGRHSLSQEVGFVNKSLTKVNKAKLKEGRYASLDDELSAIENGGWDMFDNSDLADPDMADRIRQDAQEVGMSDLDYANLEERLDDIEDDFVYEVARNGNINYAETPFRGYRDIFDEMKMELDAEGEVMGSYGHVITTVDDLANDVLRLELDAIYGEWGIDIPFASDINHCFTIEKAMKRLAPYANDNYPSCKSFFETLMNISKEYNATVTEFNLKWPPLVRIPDQAGTLEENSVSGSLPASIDSFLQDVAQMYGGIDYTDIMHFAKKATDADIKKLRSIRNQYRDDIDDEDDAERVAKQAASYVKSVLAESKRRPSKKRVREHWDVESHSGMTARIYLAENVKQEQVSSYIEVMNEYHSEYRIGCPAHAELKIGGLNMAQAQDVLEEAPDVGAQVGVRVVKVAFEY